MNIITRLQNLRRSEHESTVEIVESLVTCNRERAFLDHGCSTIWEFLVRELKYSNAAASRRYKAMKCAEKYPQVIVMLRKHQVSLSSLAKAESLLDRVSDPQELLERISGRSQNEVERIVAREQPVPRKPREVVRRVAVDRSRPSEAPLFAEPAPLVEDRVTLRTSMGSEDYDAFEKARAIVSRKHPGATIEDVLNELVEFYLKQKAPKRRKEAKDRDSSKDRKAVKDRESANHHPTARHIPVATRDTVMLRDKQRCTFRSESGRRCAAIHNLQIDHIRPFALGGTHDAENLRVLCAAHNQHRARKTFGARSVPQRN